MSTTLSSEARERIAEAIALSYREAEVREGGEGPAIVPLRALLSAFPLRCEEVPALTRRRAIEHLRRRSGGDLALPGGPDEPLAGFLYTYPYGAEVWGCLLVEQGDIVERRRFSAAHELGHYLLHFVPLVKRQLMRGEHLFLEEGFAPPRKAEETPDEEADELSGPAHLYREDDEQKLQAVVEGVPEMEAEANRFAAELLMPAPAVRRLWERHQGRATARRLATEFLVSPAAMRLRLTNLGLLV